jgi:hypothetical protein
VSYDLIMQGVTLALVIYFGLHLRSQLRTLKHTVEAQKATIEAQAESMKAQSTVLQDLERHNKIMQQVIDFFDPTAQLQREQAYKARVDRDAAETLQQSITKAQEQSISSYIPVVVGLVKLVSDMMPFFDLKRRRTLIEASGLPSPLKEQFLENKRLATDEQSLELYQDVPPPQNFPGEPR